MRSRPTAIGLAATFFAVVATTMLACGSRTSLDLSEAAETAPFRVPVASDAGASHAFLADAGEAADSGNSLVQGDAATLAPDDAATPGEDAAVNPPDAATVTPTNTGRCILLGADIDNDFSTTWLWDGATWTQLAPAASPNARSSAAHAILGSTVVVFGGYAVLTPSTLPPGVSGETTYVNDTWVWDGVSWSAPSTAITPAARDAASMVNLDDKVILFGGESPGSVFGDTWQWDGSSWTELPPTGAPTPRARAMGATANGKMLLFGGVTGQYNTALTVDETWELDGTGWTQRHPATSPSPRGSAAIAAVGDHIVLFGGQTQTGGYLDDTWIWDGTNWTEVETTQKPPLRAYASAGAIGSTFVLAGGLGGKNPVELDDTWIFDGTTWTEVDTPAPNGLDSGFGALSCF